MKPPPVEAWGVYHQGCGDEDEIGLVLVPAEGRTPSPIGVFPSEADAKNAMERWWEGGEVRRVLITEA